MADHGKCECGAALTFTGPPINETYCSDTSCKAAWNRMVAAIRARGPDPLVGKQKTEVEGIAAELRHAYKQLMESDDPMTKNITRGILGPQIERLEKLTRPQVFKLPAGDVGSDV